MFPVACALVLLAGIVRGFSGFGAALVMVPGLTMVYGARSAVPMAMIIDWIAVLQLLPVAYRHAERATVWPLGLAAVASLPIGSMILVSVEPEAMKTAIGIVVLVFVGIMSLGWRYRGRPSKIAAAAAGVVGGILNGATGMGGPPAILFYLSGERDARVARASLAGVFAVTTTAGLITFVLLGLIDGPLLLKAAFLAPTFMIGVWLGGRCFGRAAEKVYRRAAMVILTLIAISALLN